MVIQTRKTNPVGSRVALVGAYERDNFGDVLFLELTSALLRGAEVLPTAPFGSQDDYRPANRDVLRLDEVLDGPPLDALWMVGGEAGGTSIASAYKMAANEGDFAAYSKLDRKARMRHLATTAGRSHHASPYLPRPSSDPRTWSTRFVVNSAGLSGLRGLIGHRRDEAWAAVREAQFVSVRDAESSAVLRAENITHTLAPDLVHSLRGQKPDWLLRTPTESKYALIHVKESLLESFGPQRLAEVIMGSESLSDLRILLFVAGSARGHDSTTLYQDVVEACEAMGARSRVSIAAERSPMAKAELIARASIWIGTSLHGLIISSSFDVPRVGLELEKLVRYARTWDETMPVGVSLGDIDAASATALATAVRASRAEELSELATDNALQAVEAALTPRHDLATTRGKASAALKRRSKSPLRTILTSGAEILRETRRR